MPNPAEFTNQDEWMKVCVPRLMDEGKDNSQAVGACVGMWNDKTDAAKFRVLTLGAVKAVGDWELDVLAVPFGSRDSDGQWFDDQTDIMHETFSTPLAIYQHGIKQGGKELEERPLVLGTTTPGSLKKQRDGWHVRVVLNKALKQAKDIMEAAWKKAVAVSSDSISHWARLEVGGKLIQYEKNRPGRIAVWPLAGFSLWEMGNGNFRPANRMAMALPAMKAIYREAGLPFPALDTHGAAEAELVKQRAEIRAKAIEILEKTNTEL